MDNSKENGISFDSSHILYSFLNNIIHFIEHITLLSGNELKGHFTCPSEQVWCFTSVSAWNGHNTFRMHIINDSDSLGNAVLLIGFTWLFPTYIYLFLLLFHSISVLWRSYIFTYIYWKTVISPQSAKNFVRNIFTRENWKLCSFAEMWTWRQKRCLLLFL